MHTLDEYLDEGDTPYSHDFYYWPVLLFQYYSRLTLGEDIEIDHLMWKQEQHRMIPKYDIMSSLVPPVKHYNLNIE